jgi:hypothetical protein
LPPERN